MDFENVLRLARQLVVHGVPVDQAVQNSVIPSEYRDLIRQHLNEETTIEMSPLKVIADSPQEQEWLNSQDRRQWVYWLRLRDYLINSKDWPLDRVRSLDDATDQILARLSYPEIQQFQKRGLVLGYVQSGKTANYTALIAKAADVGYRLFIVLTGMDNGLRRQTQLRLQAELIGCPEASRRGVVAMEPGKQWVSLTNEHWDGDFNAGNANTTVLHGKPVLMVIKKNGHILRRLINWLDQGPETIRSLPFLLIDDEADQASIDTAGSPQRAGEDLPDDYEKPSTINRRIRELLNKFDRQAYVAYTATPFANILVPSDAHDPEVGNDLYPKNFILDLPESPGYLGAEVLFGKSFFSGDDNDSSGLNNIRIVPKEEADGLIQLSSIPNTLREALLDFILAGAAKAEREENDKPATMLIHASHRIEQQNSLYGEVKRLFEDLKNEWRYSASKDLESELIVRWEGDFTDTTNAIFPEKIIPFEMLRQYINKFFESVEVRVLNSASEQVLDYEEEPTLKAIAVGGNKLSRGLTLEGLLISYFVRSAAQPQYDTLMQMGRWFGYHEGYQDLTRIYVTEELADWFSHLALVEAQLREDLSIYRDSEATPESIGMRILSHPAMLATGPMKQRFASSLQTSYSGQAFQTFKFSFNDPERLALISEKNLQVIKRCLAGLGRFDPQQHYPLWRGINYQLILEFLEELDFGLHADEKQEIIKYIKRRNEDSELVRWTIAVRKSLTREASLGVVDWGENLAIQQMSRTRLRGVNSIGVLTSPGDEMIGFSEDLKKEIRAGRDSKTKNSINISARKTRPAEEGLLLLYPISKYSVPKKKNGNRVPLFDNPEGPQARNLIGFAISFPCSDRERPEEYVHGRPGWTREPAEQ